MNQLISNNKVVSSRLCMQKLCNYKQLNTKPSISSNWNKLREQEIGVAYEKHI